MLKKMIGLILILAILGLVTLASAAVPSKTTQDMVQVGAVVSATGEIVSVNVWIPTAEQVQAAADELAAIAAFANAPGESLINYFDQTVKDAAAALLPAGFDMGKLTINEFVPLAVSGYVDTYGDIVASFEFATQYADGQSIVALVGIKEETGVVWTALKAEVVDGSVKIYFTQEILQKIQSGNAMLAIMSEATV